MENIVYNRTIKIDHDVHAEWLRWIKTVHIPDLMDTGLFDESRLCRLMGVDETDGITYSLQLLCPNMESYRTFQQHYAAKIQGEHFQRYRERFVSFPTIMKVID